MNHRTDEDNSDSEGYEQPDVYVPSGMWQNSEGNRNHSIAS